MSQQRIACLEPPYPAEVQASFDVIMPPGVEPLRIFRTVANNPRVLERMVRGGLLDRGSVTIAERELVILRTCARCGAEYEWGVHVSIFAARAGFSPEQIADTRSRAATSALWNEAQLLLIALVDELHEQNRVSDGLWQKLAAHYRPEQLVELVMLTGLYHAVSFVVNAFEIEKEAFAPSFPSGAAGAAP